MVSLRWIFLLILWTALDHFFSGGAGAAGTIDDYARFAGMLMQGGLANGRRMLDEKTVRYFTTACQSGALCEEVQSAWAWSGGYNYGNLLRHCVAPERAVMLANRGEYGWDGWLGTVFINDPAARTTLLVMAQLADGGFTPIARRLKNLLWRTEN